MKSIKSQKGTAIVEFTIVLPFLLMLILGISELGHFIYQYNTLNKVVRDGARYLSENSKLGSTGRIVDLSSGTIATRTKNLTVYGNVYGSGDPLLPGLNTGNLALSVDGDNVRVTATYDYRGIFVPLRLPMLNGFVEITLPDMVASATIGAI